MLFSLVCFRLRASDEHNRELLERINSTGAALLSGTTLDGKFVLRLAIGNIATTEADMQAVWDLICAEASVSLDAPQRPLPDAAPKS